MDLEYIVLPSRIKENIILQSPQDISYYVVTVYTEGLSARLLENRRIEFYDSGNEVIFTMASPYMYDSAAELSENIAVEMTSKGDGCYFIRMTPDSQWLNDQSRVYPVVIDPVVSADTTQQNIIDNYVLEGSGVQNNSLDRLYIGVKSGSKARAYIQYATMPTLPSGASITAASMTVQLLSGTSTANNASAYMVTGADWASGTITWDNKPAASTLLASNISHNSKTSYTFSCKTAVQTWYSGSTTGQNKNYGIMLRYYDETIADYNSVYSADYSDAAKRPALTITYEPPSTSTSVLEGGTCSLTPPNVTGTISWTSSDTSIATVTSSGKVTGIKAGKATISASVSGMVQKTYIVYVIITDGVYYIQNCSLWYYLGTRGGINDLTYTYLQTKQESGFSQLCQLWKITYLAQGYYSIRPMHKLDMALHIGSANVDISATSTSDTLTSIKSSFWWTITYNSSGYALKNYGSNGLALQPANGAASPGLGTIVSGYSSSATQCHWNIQKLDNPPSGTLLYNTTDESVVTLPTKYLIFGETKTLADFNLLPVGYSGGAANFSTFTWTNTNVAISVNKNTGAVTALSNSENVALITGTCSFGSVQFKVFVLPVSDGTYYVKSRAYGRYLQIDDNDNANDYSTSGAILEQWGFDSGNQQKWIISSLNNGYYSILSAQSGLGLSVASGQTESNDVSLVQEPYYGYNRQQWKIIQTDNGCYKIKPRSSESLEDDYVMAVGYSLINNSDGVNIEQRKYVDDTNYKDEWRICSFINIGISTDNYSGNANRERQSYRYATKFYDKLTDSSCGEPIDKTHHFNIDSTYSASKEDFSVNGAISHDIDFMIYIGHGHSAHDAKGNHLQYCYSTNGKVDTTNVCGNEAYSEEYIESHCVYTSEINFGSSNSDLRWVWLYTCNFLTSNDYVTNTSLKNMMSGAHIVMGYASQSYLCDAMALKFAEYLRNGEAIIDAYFMAGNLGEATATDDNHIQKVLYIPQARYETIYSPQAHYDYGVTDVIMITHEIQDEYNV